MTVKHRGFGSPKFDKTKQREIASKGGKAAQEQGTAHQFTKDEARSAGSIGGKAAARKRREKKLADELTKILKERA